MVLVKLFYQQDNILCDLKSIIEIFLWFLFLGPQEKLQEWKIKCLGIVFCYLLPRGFNKYLF